MADQITPPADQTTPPMQGATSAAPNQEVGSGEKDWKAEAEKWQHFSRQHEANWKKATGELDRLNKAGMTDAERAVAEAKESGRQEALSSIAEQRAQDKLDVAAARAGVDLTPVKGVLDISKFLANGEIDEAAISAFVSQLSSSAPKEPKFAQGLGFGPQGSGTAGQLTREQVRGMSPREVAAARKEGRLDALLRGQI
ncbi:hypothetical protein [Acrocarpospora sp. B8E8]|uniref:hypothetical protein n=1 Tax=Acrocarpospora sp. B8E8 TaxID=3153572 RepID=UPI00325C39B1